MPEEKKKDGFLLGLVIGGLIGAAAAFLLDKEDSEKVKKIIQKKGKILLDSLEDFSEDTVSDVKEKVQEIPETVSAKVDDLEKSGKSSLRHFFIKAGKKLAN